MSRADNRQLGSIRDATGMNPAWNRPQRRDDEGRPGYAWREILGSATPRDDWMNVTEARPLNPHWTGGPHYDHAGSIEGTKFDVSMRRGASTKDLADWDFSRRVDG